MSAAWIYQDAVAGFARGELDWETDTFKTLLATSEYRPDQYGHRFRDAVSPFEVEPAGEYQPGGAILRGRTVRNDHGVILLGAGTVDWDDFTGDWRYVITYLAAGNPAADRLVSCADVGNQTANQARVTIEFKAGLAALIPAQAA